MAHAGFPSDGACACACAQNANRRPNTFKMLMIASIRQKAEELGIILPDLASLQVMAERNMIQKVGQGGSV